MQILRGRRTGVDQLLISSDGRYVVAGGVPIHVWDLQERTAKPRVVPAGERGNWSRDVQFLTATRLFILTAQPCEWYRHDIEAGVTTNLGRPPTTLWETVCVNPSGGAVKVHTRVGGGSQDEAPSCQVSIGDGVPPLGPDVPGPLLDALFGFNPDGTRYFAQANRFVGGAVQWLHVYDTATDALVTTLSRPAGQFHSSVCAWCFRPDGRELFVVVASRRLLRYDCPIGGQPIAEATIAGQDVRVRPAIATHPDGRVLATVEDGRAVTFRDAETLEVLRTYDFNMPTVTCVAFTPDGTRCVIGNSRGKVLLFDVD